MNDQFIEALSRAIDVHVQLRKELVADITPTHALLASVIDRGRLVVVLCVELTDKKGDT